MSDQSNPHQWTPEQKASFARWKRSSVQAAERYMEFASARWRNFCDLAPDAERGALRGDVGRAIAERDHSGPEPECECGDVAGHARRLADEITFDPGRYFRLVSDSMEEYGFRIAIDSWLNGHGWTAEGPPIRRVMPQLLDDPEALQEDDEDESENAYSCPFCGQEPGTALCPHAIAYGDDMPEWVEEFEDVVPIGELNNIGIDWKALAGTPYWEDVPPDSNFLEALQAHPGIVADAVFWEGICISGYMWYVTAKSEVRDALHAELREVCRRIVEADAQEVE